MTSIFKQFGNTPAAPLNPYAAAPEEIERVQQPYGGQSPLASMSPELFFNMGNANNQGTNLTAGRIKPSASAPVWTPPKLDANGHFTSQQDIDDFKAAMANSGMSQHIQPGSLTGATLRDPQAFKNNKAAGDWAQANNLWHPPAGGHGGLRGALKDFGDSVTGYFKNVILSPPVLAALTAGAGTALGAGAGAAAGSAEGAAGSDLGMLGATSEGVSGGVGALGSTAPMLDAGYVMPGADAAASSTGSTLADISAASAAPAGAGTAGIGAGAPAAAAPTAETGGALSSVGSWIAAHPGMSAIGALTALGLAQKKPEGPAAAAVPGQNWLPATHATPLDRRYIPYEGNYHTYGQTSGSHQFFDPVAYNPDFLPGLSSGPNDKTSSTVPHMAKGGTASLSPLHAIAGAHYTTDGSGPLVTGPGGGQDDKVPAWLANGEYVFDASTVSDLGDGSTEEGAKKLDQLREAIRQHKRGGAKGLPPKAKPTTAYMRGGL